VAEQAERAEQMGFHSFWLPESHFSGDASCPSPLVLLAGAATRTRSLRLGTTSYLLTVRHPIQVAEDVAVLDRMSGGRVVLGVGRGFRSALFEAFRVSSRDKRDRFEAALATIRAAWLGEPVAWDERESERAPIRLSPLPVQQPHPPVWVAAFGPKAVAQAGRLGLPYLASPVEPLATLEENLARHREAAAEAGVPGPAAVPVMRTIFVSREEAVLERVRDALGRQAASLARAPVASLRRAAQAEVGDWALVGEPAAVADQIARHRERLGITHLLARVHVPEATPAERDASLELLASLER
jgi:alkanesulfonate monooxygenase SsuD/methylene tetrahydromethanopterin reductase-like flavin-dependent oxidoreductase (luciferase family)